MHLLARACSTARLAADMACNAGASRGHLLRRSCEWRAVTCGQWQTCRRQACFSQFCLGILQPKQWCCICLVPEVMGKTAAMVMKPGGLCICKHP